MDHYTLIIGDPKRPDRIGDSEDWTVGYTNSQDLRQGPALAETYGIDSKKEKTGLQLVINYTISEDRTNSANARRDIEYCALGKGKRCHEPSGDQYK